MAIDQWVGLQGSNRPVSDRLVISCRTSVDIIRIRYYLRPARLWRPPPSNTHLSRNGSGGGAAVNRRTPPMGRCSILGRWCRCGIYRHRCCTVQVPIRNIPLIWKQGGHRALKVLEKKLSFFHYLESPLSGSQSTRHTVNSSHRFFCDELTVSFSWLCDELTVLF